MTHQDGTNTNASEMSAKLSNRFGEQGGNVPIVIEDDDEEDENK
jgi:hypothetical protein